MNKDKVKFILTAQHYVGAPPSRRKKLQKILQACFDINHARSNGLFESNIGGFNIVCRPGQFARFLIHRNNAGIPNSFKELNPVLFESPSINEVDVSKNYHQKCYSPPNFEDE